MTISKIPEQLRGIHEAPNGGSAKGLHLTNGSARSTPVAEKYTDDDFAVLSFRNFLFDICNQNGGGHGGSALGMAAIGVALYKYVMRYNPSNSEWFDRDRFVLSNGKRSTIKVLPRTLTANCNFLQVMLPCFCMR